MNVLPTVIHDPTLPAIELNGRRFHSEAHGDPADPVVVVLHGGPGGDYRSLLPLAALADRFRVVFYDQRGAGLSERVPPEELTAETALADLDAIIEHHSPDGPVSLIGHSWGATLAAGYCRSRPDRVRAAVLAEPGYLDPEEYRAWRRRYRTLMTGWRYWLLAIRAGVEARRVQGPDEDAQDDFLVGERILPAFLAHPDNPYRTPGCSSAPSWRWGRLAGRALEGETFPDPAGGHPVFDGPVLFVAGAANTWIGEGLQAEHARRYPNARIAVVPRAAHDMVWDNPRDTLAVVRGFLATSHPESRLPDVKGP